MLPVDPHQAGTKSGHHPEAEMRINRDKLPEVGRIQTMDPRVRGDD